MPGISVAINAYDNTKAAFASFSNNARAAGARVNSMTAAAGANRKVMAEYTKTAEKASKANRRMGVSFNQLLMLMIKFGIAMQLIQLPSRIVGMFTGAIAVTKEWERELTLTNTILRLNAEQTKIFSRSVANMNIQIGGSIDTVKALFDAAQQLVGIDLEPVRGEFAGLTRQAQAVLDLTRIAQKGALASGAAVEDVTDALGKVVSLLGLKPTQGEDILDILFRIQELSDLRIQDLAQGVGEVLPLVDLMTQGQNTDKVLAFAEAIALVGTFSQTFGAARAFTGFRNFFTALVGTGSEQKKMRAELTRLGVKFTIADLAANGLAATFREIKKLSPSGEIVDLLVANRGLAGSVGEANERIEISAQLIRQLFPNIRASTAVMAGMTQNFQVFEETLKGTLDWVGRGNAAFDRMAETLDLTQKRSAAAANMFRIAIGQDLKPALAGALNLFAKWTENIVNMEEFIGAPLPGKIAIYLQEFTNQFDEWFRTTGRYKIQAISQDIGRTFAEFFANTIGSGSANIYFEAGIDAMKAFTGGFFKTMLGVDTRRGFATTFADMLSSVVGRGIASGLLLSMLGVGKKKAIIGGAALGVGGAMLPQNDVLQNALSLATGMLLFRGAGGAISKIGKGIYGKLGLAAVPGAGAAGFKGTQGRIPAGFVGAAGRAVGGQATKLSLGALIARSFGMGGAALGAGRLLGLLGGPWGWGLMGASIALPLLYNWVKGGNKQPQIPVGALPGRTDQAFAPLSEALNVNTMQAEILRVNSIQSAEALGLDRLRPMEVMRADLSRPIQEGDKNVYISNLVGTQVISADVDINRVSAEIIDALESVGLIVEDPTGNLVRTGQGE